MTDRQWLVTAICDHCLASDTGRAILSGAVGIATLRTGETELCILCGWPFAEQESGTETLKTCLPEPTGKQDSSGNAPQTEPHPKLT